MKVFKILDLVPVVFTEGITQAMKDREKLAEEIEKITGGLIKLEIKTLEKGTASIESLYDEYLNAPYILKEVKEAEKRGFDAVVIDCFGDPALEAAREIVEIPVVGANHSACFLATQIAGRFSIINILPETEHQILNLESKYGLLNHLASIETIDVPVLEIENRQEEIIERIVEVALKAYKEAKAFAIVLGCTGLSFIAEKVEKTLKNKGVPLPVIEPLRAAIFTAISWSLMGISQSKVAFMKPRSKYRVVDFPLPI